jgi:hypothetical protein
LAWPSESGTFFGKLAALAADLEVSLPLIPGKSVFTPLSVKFKAGAELDADPSSHVDSDDPDSNAYSTVLEGVCAELIASFKSNFKSETDCNHMALGSFPNVTDGFSGTLKMSSIS